jgi:predicted alpha/beta hydrolase family esterase
MKKQIVVIHGGDTFETHEDWFSFLKVKKLDFERIKNPQGDWKSTLGEKLGSEFETIYPQMPNKQNSKYAEWKIWFETMLPHLEPEVVFVGHSLGSLFLVRYFSENKYPKKIRATFLVATPYDTEGVDYSLADFYLRDDLSDFEAQGGKIFMYHSEDDPVVPASGFKKYQKTLKNATFRIFKDRQHFNIEEFPEIIEDIKSVY